MVGETGSGKTTFAKLLTRMMDPVEGRVLVDGVDLRELSFASLRSRVVMVPQDGFLFEGSIADNVRLGRPAATDDEIELAMVELGLVDWLDGLPHRLRDRRRAARGADVGGGAAAGGARAGLRRRPGPARPGRSNLGGGPGDRGPDRRARWRG